MPAIAPMPSPFAPLRASSFGRSSACLLALLALGGSLAGCGSLNNATSRVANVITPYRVEIVQGNFVSREQVAALQPGMARAQVREVLGSPLVTSAFHTDRWDYVFTLVRQGVEPQSRKLTVYFKNDLFDRIEGDEMPTEAEFVSQINARRNFGKVPLLEVPDDVLREFSLKNTSVATPAAAAVVLAAAPVTYPALEVPGSQTQAWDASTLRAAALAGAARPPAPALASSPSAAPALASATPAAQSSATVPSPAVVAIAPAPVPAPVVARAAVAPVPAAAAARPAAAPVAPVAAPAAMSAAASIPAAVAAVAVPAAAAVVAVAPRTVAVAPAPVSIPAPAPAAPAPVPAVPSAAPFSSLDPELGGFLTGWMNDWQSRNAGGFFARYAADFKGSSTSREEWEALRRPRIEGRQRVSIGVLDVRARMVSSVEARVVFRQVYESDAFNENGTKAMFLSKQNGRWIIDREFFTPAQ